MPSISISGIGSGIDFNAVRDAIINQRAIPINQLQSKVSRYNSRIDSLKEMNLLLANLTNAANDLTRADLG
jgi:flagellar capping protein FliD